METVHRGDRPLAKKIGIVGLVMCAISFAFIAAAQIAGGPVPWTSWASAPLMASMIGVSIFVPPTRFRRLKNVFYCIVSLVWLAVIVSVMSTLLKV